MRKTIVGTFETRGEADEVVAELCAAGFAEREIALLWGEGPGANALIDAGVPAGEVPAYAAALRRGRVLVALRIAYSAPSLSVATDTVLGAPPLRQSRMVA